MKRILSYLSVRSNASGAITQLIFPDRAGALPASLKTNRLSKKQAALVCFVGMGVLFFGSILSACKPDTVESGLMPEIVVAAPTSSAIQAAINAAPSTGAHIILPPGDYIATKQVSLTNKNKITIDGQGKANWIGSSAVPNLFALLGTCRDIRLTGINFSTTAGPGRYNYGLINTFEQSFIDGYEIDHCSFTSPDAPINLIYFLPYSPLSESGNGQGAMQRNINIHDCIGKNGGRAFCELNAHVHADGRTDVYFENFRFSHNTITNMGTQDANFGPALSLSGMGSNVTADSNDITDTKFSGLEFVNTRNVSSANNRFKGVQNTFSAYSISGAGTGKTTGVVLTNNSGTVKGRAYTLHDVESFTVTGGTFTTDQKIELQRAKNGLVSQINLTVVHDVSAVFIAESDAVEVSKSQLTTTQPKDVASVITIMASSRSIVVRDNTLSRPANAVGDFIESITSSGNTIGPNVERNN